jgi:hypothetical protein
MSMTSVPISTDRAGAFVTGIPVDAAARLRPANDAAIRNREERP